MPLLWAPAKPMFSSFRINRTRDGSSGGSTLSLSMTMISKPS